MFKKGRVPWNKGLHPEYMQGENHPMHGKAHTEEAKLKNRLAHLGKRASPRTEFKKGDKRILGSSNINWNGGLQQVHCLLCGKAFKVKPYRSKVVKYCSYECYWKAKKIPLGTKSHRWKGGKVRLICELCQKEYYRFPSDAEGAKYCSKKCQNETFALSITGENNINWKGGLSSETEKLRETKQYEHWRQSVYAKDHYICQECEQKCKKLIAHHLKSFADYPELRFNVDNGITYCRGCHLNIHRKLRRVVV